MASFPVYQGRGSLVDWTRIAQVKAQTKQAQMKNFTDVMNTMAQTGMQLSALQSRRELEALERDRLTQQIEEAKANRKEIDEGKEQLKTAFPKLLSAINTDDLGALAEIIKGIDYGNPVVRNAVQPLFNDWLNQTVIDENGKSLSNRTRYMQFLSGKRIEYATEAQQAGEQAKAVAKGTREGERDAMSEKERAANEAVYDNTIAVSQLSTDQAIAARPHVEEMFRIQKESQELGLEAQRVAIARQALEAQQAKVNIEQSSVNLQHSKEMNPLFVDMAKSDKALKDDAVVISGLNSKLEEAGFDLKVKTYQEAMELSLSEIRSKLPQEAIQIIDQITALEIQKRAIEESGTGGGIFSMIKNVTEKDRTSDPDNPIDIRALYSKPWMSEQAKADAIKKLESDIGKLNWQKEKALLFQAMQNSYLTEEQRAVALQAAKMAVYASQMSLLEKDAEIKYIEAQVRAKQKETNMLYPGIPASDGKQFAMPDPSKSWSGKPEPQPLAPVPGVPYSGTYTPNPARTTERAKSIPASALSAYGPGKTVYKSMEETPMGGYFEIDGNVYRKVPEE